MAPPGTQSPCVSHSGLARKRKASRRGFETHEDRFYLKRVRTSVWAGRPNLRVLLQPPVASASVLPVVSRRRQGEGPQACSDNRYSGRCMGHFVATCHRQPVASAELPAAACNVDVPPLCKTRPSLCSESHSACGFEHKKIGSAVPVLFLAVMNHHSVHH